MDHPTFAADHARYKGLFETPFITAPIANSRVLNEKLKAAIELRMNEQGSAGRRSNVGGWQSDTGMLQWGGEAPKELGVQVLHVLGRFTTDRGQAPSGPPRFEWSSEMWANVNVKGGFHEPHTHPGAIWSAVYYVDDGLVEGESPEMAGRLVLQDPRDPLPIMYKPDLRHVTDKGELYTNDVRLAPQVGNVVIFPSWLSHYVTPNMGSGKRISIAINYLALPARQQV